MVDIEADHVHVLNKAQMICVNTEITPVCVHDVLGQWRHLQCFEYPIDWVGSSTQVVRIFFLQHLGVRFASGSCQIVACRQGFCPQSEEFFDGFPAPWYILLHFIDEVFLTAWKCCINRCFPITGSRNYTEIIRNLIPWNIQTKFIHHGLPAVARVLCAAKFTELMQRCFKFEAASPKAGSDSAGQIVLLYQKSLLSCFCQSAGCRKPTVSGANYHGIKLWHKRVLLLAYWCDQECPQLQFTKAMVLLSTIRLLALQILYIVTN